MRYICSGKDYGDDDVSAPPFDAVKSDSNVNTVYSFNNNKQGIANFGVPRWGHMMGPNQSAVGYPR